MRSGNCAPLQAADRERRLVHEPLLQLVGRRLGDQQGAAPITAWRPTIRELSRLLSAALCVEDPGREPGLDPASDSSSPASLAVAQARQCWQQGLRLPKGCRQGYLDLFAEVPLRREEREQGQVRMERCFDQLELALLCDPVAGSVGILEVVRDVTESCRAEQALKDSEQRLHQITDLLPVPTWIIDEDGVVVAWDQAMERVSGVLNEQMVGRGQQEYAVPFHGTH